MARRKKKAKKISHKLDSARSALAGSASAIEYWREWEEGRIRKIVLRPKRSAFKGLTNVLGRKGSPREQEIFEKAFISTLSDLFTQAGQAKHLGRTF